MKTEDGTQSAFRVLQHVIDQTEDRPTKKNVVPVAKPAKPKDQAAVTLGRKGGLKSAKARMEKILPEDRSAIASKAARARWAKERKDRP